MRELTILLVVIFGVLTIEGAIMTTIDTKTRDCDDCGMSILGYLQLQVLDALYV